MGPGRVSEADRRQLARHPVSVRRIGALFAPHKWTLVLVLVLISVSSLIGMAQPFLVRGVIDRALPEANRALLVGLALAMVAVAAVTSALSVVQTWLSSNMGQEVMHKLRSSVFTHLQNQSLEFFTRTRGGEVQSRLINDISAMQNVVTNSATQVASQLTAVVAAVVAMLALSPLLTALSLLVLPPAALLSRKVALMRRDLMSRRQHQMAQLHTQVEEGLSISGIRLTKTLGSTQRSAKRFESASQELVGLEVASQLAGRWRMATMSIVFAAIPAAIYVASGGAIAEGRMTIGTLVAFTALQTTIFRPLMGLLNVGVQWVTAQALFSRIFEYLDLKPEVADPVNPVKLDPKDVSGMVSFDNVTFQYQDEAPVLQNVSIQIPAGSSAALVGPTGSGKSTMAALLSRLHDPKLGKVSIDGVNIADLALEDLAQIVGVVSQETYLVHATVRENLTLAKPAASEKELWDALEAAQISQLVAELPEGLDTVVGARGHRFSGGERQRLAIARTLLKNPRVLVLDEATSALDTRTEAKVQAALDELVKGRTTLTIAHRLTTVQSADQVLVLDRGRIAERGSAASLRRSEGLFAELSLAS